MNLVTIFWYLESKITGAYIDTGSYHEMIATRDRIATEARENGRDVTFYNRKRIMVIRNDDLFERYKIGRVQIPESELNEVKIS